MASVVVTVLTTAGGLDLSLPAGAPLRDIIPDLVYICTDSGRRSPSSQWAVGAIGAAQPFSPQKTLDECGVLDGQFLYLHDMASGTDPPSRNTGAAVAVPPRAPKLPPVVRSTPKAEFPVPSGRFGWRPSPSGTYALGLILLAACALSAKLVSANGAGISLLMALLVAGAFVIVLWWMGYFHIAACSWNWSWAAKFPVPSGLPGAAPGLNGRGTGAATATELHIDGITKLAEDFINDLGRLLAGQNPDLAYMEPAVASSLRQLVIPLHLSGDRIEPRFSSPQLTVTPDPRQPIVFAEVRFDDHSVRVAANGARRQEPQRQVAIQLVLDRAASKILRANLSAMAV